MRNLAVVVLVLSLPLCADGSEGVIEINQVCAVDGGCLDGDAAGFPVTISVPGSYRLVGDLVTSTGVTAINISADDVSLDLAGHGITTGSESPVAGGIMATGNRVLVENGSVTNFYVGVSLAGTDSVVQGMRIRQSGFGDTIFAGSRCRVLNNSTNGGSFEGSVVLGASCLVEGNSFFCGGNGPALVVAGDAVIRGNYIRGVDGGLVAPSSVVSGNRVQAALAGTAIMVVRGGVISENVASGGGSGFAIYSSDSMVSNNRVTGLGAGIRCADCTVIGNVASGLVGVALDATGGSGSTGYGGNQFNGNNGGNVYPQVVGGVEIGANVCGGDSSCP